MDTDAGEPPIIAGGRGRRRPRTVPGDWHPGTIPANVVQDETAHIETSYIFVRYRSRRPVGLEMGRGAALYNGTMLDVGPRGRVRLGECALVTAVRFICDAEIEIGDHALISWNVVLMDTYRLPRDPAARRRALERRQAAARGVEGHQEEEAAAAASPIRIGNNVWIGFDACILPGVTIGEGSVVGARSVVAGDVPPYTVVAGNPARVVRHLDRPSDGHERERKGA